MTYAKVSNGSVIGYPYSFLEMRNDHPDIIFNADDNLEQAIEYGRYPVIEEPPEYDPRRQYVTPKALDQWFVDGDEVRAAYTIHTRTLRERRDVLIPRIEQMRWDKEIGGMTFGGVSIPTDDRAKTLIMGARTAAVEQGEAYSDEWKISPGVYVPLDAAAAIALGDALLAHIRACFAREKALIQAVLDASTHAAMDEAEDAIEEGWPE